MTYNLFLCVLVRGQEVDCLYLTKVNVVTEEEDEEELAHIFLLLISIECLVSLQHKRQSSPVNLTPSLHNYYLELAPDVGQLFVYPLDLGLLALAVPDV